MEFQEDPALEPRVPDKVEPGARPYMPQAETPIKTVDTIAKERFPELLQRAKDFYARHPTLVKALGTVAAAALARRMFPGRPRRSRFFGRPRFF
jgi:hypothetical protein